MSDKMLYSQVARLAARKISARRHYGACAALYRTAVENGGHPAEGLWLSNMLRGLFRPLPEEVGVDCLNPWWGVYFGDTQQEIKNARILMLLLFAEILEEKEQSGELAP